jgi:hypothetical protein
MSLFKPKQKPINVNDEANHQTCAALITHVQALHADEVGSIAAPHLHRIAQRHLRNSNVLDRMLEASESAARRE